MKHNKILRLAVVLALALSSLPGGHAAAYDITVDTTSDEIDAGDCESIDSSSGMGRDGVRSLREAICIANNTPGADTIEFDIPATTDAGCNKDGVCTIQPNSSSDGCLPPLTDNSTTIDGYSQTGAAYAVNGTPAVLKIELDGSIAGSCDGLTITSANNRIYGLVINRFGYTGILISGSGVTGNHIQGNYIGVDPIGDTDLGNTTMGINVQSGASNNLIGGGVPATRNLISGNGSSGIILYGSGTDNNVVSGNYIGTDKDGDTSLQNDYIGVYLSGGSQGNTIGGDTAGERNLISGNDNAGIEIYGTGTMSNTVSGNYIGVDVSGGTPLGNNGYGVSLLENADYNTIGGDTAGERNVISGNLDRGIYIRTDHNIVSGNYIGVDASGETSLGNTGYGIYLRADFNMVGGSTPGERNVISGNTSSGVFVNEAIGNTISGNYIGVDKDGDTDRGNGHNGIYLAGGSQENTIGGDTAGERNVISGNDWHGLSIYATDTISNTVIGNYIGLDASGGTALGNSDHGVRIENNAHSNTIGGDASGERNVISGNGESGIYMLTNNNTVIGNYIGTDASGTLDKPNLQHGIYLKDCQNNIIGGSTQGERNLISGNTTYGVNISNSDSNSIVGNFIGVDASGSTALGNGSYGVRVAEGSTNNTVGPNNLIASNSNDGVLVNGASDIGNIITRNAIYSNTMGIDLVTGANGNIQPPVIMTATLGSVNISGTACANCTVEVFDNHDTDGEGEHYIGATVADTNGDFTLSVAYLPHLYLTATASTVISGTSEFSAVYHAVGMPTEAVFLPLVVK
jgi:hypothetical protein